MAKSLFPSRRGPGRSAQREKPGDAIRAMFAANPKGVTIGDCHRYYTALRLLDWQKEELAKMTGASRQAVSSSEPRDLIAAKAARVHPRSPAKQDAFITRKMKAVDKIMARKRAPGNTTYENFSKFFHFLLQAGYIAHQTERDRFGKVTRSRATPKMQDGSGDQIMDAFKARSTGQPAVVQIEPPVIYIITDLGWSVEDWNNPRKGIA